MLRFKSTNCYLIEGSGGLLAFDAGWPGTYRDYRDELRATGWKMQDIRWLVVSHFHIDHAGLAGEFQQNGIQFIVFENQVNYIDEMESLIQRKKDPYRPIRKDLYTLMNLADSRKWLKSIGIDGEIIQIFGHGDQSIALVLDSGDTFIGDLPMLPEYDELVRSDWQRLTALGARQIYPAHVQVDGADFRIPGLEARG